MAEPLPAALRVPEVSRFVRRATQLRSAKPAIAYWCEYHAVNQIVGKSLHTGDEEAFEFTKTLLERLETTKSERPEDDAIIDNDAGQAYVEQFAEEVFERAERTRLAKKVTKQTADTYDAAATFFDLLREWGEPEAEILAKIKWAKYNAARILRAIRNGEDPNESDPQQAEPAEAALSTPGAAEPDAAQPRPATVEDVPDAGDASSSVPPTFVDEPPRPPPADPGYFPPVTPADSKGPEPFIPSPLSQSPPPPPGPTAPSPGPAAPPPPFPAPGVQPTPPVVPHQMPPPPQSPYSPAHQLQPPHFTPTIPSPGSNPSAPPSWSTTPSIPHPAATNPPPTLAQPSAPTFTTPVPQPVAPPPPAAPAPNYVPDQKAINESQKHAKWAISALNFEDIPTAVNELRAALAKLGAQ